MEHEKRRPVRPGLRLKRHSRRVVTSGNETRTKVPRKCALMALMGAQPNARESFTCGKNSEDATKLGLGGRRPHRFGTLPRKVSDPGDPPPGYRAAFRSCPRRNKVSIRLPPTENSPGGPDRLAKLHGARYAYPSWIVPAVRLQTLMSDPDRARRGAGQRAPRSRRVVAGLGAVGGEHGVHDCAAADHERCGPNAHAAELRPFSRNRACGDRARATSRMRSAAGCQPIVSEERRDRPPGARNGDRSDTADGRPNAVRTLGLSCGWGRKNRARHKLRFESSEGSKPGPRVFFGKKPFL